MNTSSAPSVLTSLSVSPSRCAEQPTARLVDNHDKTTATPRRPDRQPVNKPEDSVRAKTPPSTTRTTTRDPYEIALHRVRARRPLLV